MTNPHDPPPLPPEIRATTPGSATKALFIGFFPAMMVIVLVSLGTTTGMLDKITQQGAQALAVLACLITVACAFTSSFMLFRRHKKGVALAAVVLLLLINAGVAFFFGCSALLLA